MTRGATYASVEELSELLSTAGYSEVRRLEKYERDFICGMGTVPL